MKKQSAKPKKQTEQVEPKKKEKPRLSYHEQKEWDTIEDDIELIEEKINDLQTQIAAEGSNIEAVQDLYTDQQALESELEEKMERSEERRVVKECRTRSGGAQGR